MGAPPLLDERLVSLLPSPAAGAEPYLTVRYVLEEAQRQAGLSIVAVSSALAGDGKTTTAINVAGALGHGDGRLLLIDADLRHPSLERQLLGPREGPGLVDFLVDPELALADVVASPSHLPFDVLTAGRPTATPYDVLRTPRFAALLEEARGRYGHVVVDTPALLPAPDCRVIEKSVDGFLVVVAAHRTPRTLVAAGLRLVDPAKLIGIVFNGDPHLPWGHDHTRSPSARLASAWNGWLDRIVDALPRRHR